LRLIHLADDDTADVGDTVTSSKGDVGVITHFRPPHKPNSEGHVTVALVEGLGSQYNYVSVWGLQWINREDRLPFIKDKASIYRQALESALKWCQEDVANEDAYPTQDMMEARVHELEEILAP